MYSFRKANEKLKIKFKVLLIARWLAADALPCSLQTRSNLSPTSHHFTSNHSPPLAKSHKIKLFVEPPSHANDVLLHICMARTAQ